MRNSTAGAAEEPLGAVGVEPGDDVERAPLEPLAARPGRGASLLDQAQRHLAADDVVGLQVRDDQDRRLARGRGLDSAAGPSVTSQTSRPASSWRATPASPGLGTPPPLAARPRSGPRGRDSPRGRARGPWRAEDEERPTMPPRRLAGLAPGRDPGGGSCEGLVSWEGIKPVTPSSRVKPQASTFLHPSNQGRSRARRRGTARRITPRPAHHRASRNRRSHPNPDRSIGARDHAPVRPAGPIRAMRVKSHDQRPPGLVSWPGRRRTPRTGDDEHDRTDATDADGSLPRGKFIGSRRISMTGWSATARSPRTIRSNS